MTKESKNKDKPLFVIHKHDARNLHYDFRLEIDGSLKSWAIPKGPSTDPGEKRMAVPTEDHPMKYAGFEGVIPEGEHGAGTVMVWDKGTFENIKKKNGKKVALKKCFKDGEIEINLHGKKVKGGYTLVKMESGKMKGNWLLIKMKDKDADARRNPVSTEPDSVKTHRSLKEISKEEK